MKGMSVDKCVEKAQGLIKKNGVCLLLFDVENSGKVKNRRRLNEILERMMADLNYKFYDYMPKHELATYQRREKGFQILLGDASWAGINSSEIIPEIIKYQREKYPQIPLHWGVAENGYDEATRIVK